jgi:hypothetical protein
MQKIRSGTRRGCRWRNRVHANEPNFRKSSFCPLPSHRNKPSVSKREPNPQFPIPQRKEDSSASRLPAPNRSRRPDPRKQVVVLLHRPPAAMSFIFGKKKTPAGTSPSLWRLVRSHPLPDRPLPLMGSPGRNWAYFWYLGTRSTNSSPFSVPPPTREPKSTGHSLFTLITSTT